MEQEKLHLLIDRLELYARRRPAEYRLRVALLAALGYAYLLAVVILLLLIAYLTLSIWKGFLAKSQVLKFSQLATLILTRPKTFAIRVV
jgi:hypothetical protein